MHLSEFEAVPQSHYSSKNVSLSTSKMAPYQVLTFKTSMNPLRFCIIGKSLLKPSLAKQTRLGQISRPQCSGGWYQAFAWTSVLLLTALDSWLCLKDNPRHPLCLSLPSAPDWGTLGWRVSDISDKGIIGKKWQNMLDRGVKQNKTNKQKKTVIQRHGSKSCCYSWWWREQSPRSQIDRDRDRSEQLWHLCVRQCFIDAACLPAVACLQCKTAKAKASFVALWLVWMSDSILAAKCFHLDRQNNGCLCCVKQTEVSVREGKRLKCGPAALSEGRRFYS